MIDLEELEIRAARPEDLPEILDLLRSNGLVTEGVEDHIGTYVVVRDGGELVGCGGSEAYQFAALVRSVAVREDYRGNGIGRRVVRELIDRLASRGLREFYLLTIDAEGYFKRRGFRPIDRDEIHPQLLGSAELQGACPDDAVAMRMVMP
ncbi:MAG: arsenic resistance N-acetyltransferase ArsN2 [Thermoanaerobaculia bacterium]|nr:arsenic resistance N-acetyltransferase ArsN2 [Thermoanaerobaculia bacterium]